jgi:nucleoside phosphorylase
MIAHTTLAFVFATLMEANPFIAMFNAEQTSKEPWPVYQARISGQPTIIIITGMGMSPAKNATEFVIEYYAANTIINCGVAGCLTDESAVGEIINVTDSWVSQVEKVHEDVCRLSAHSYSLDGYKDGALLTVDQAIFDQGQKKILSDIAQFVDMEGGVIARICEQNNIPCQLIKIVSDYAVERNQLKSNLDYVSEKLAHSIAININRLFSQKIMT